MSIKEFYKNMLKTDYENFLNEYLSQHGPIITDKAEFSTIDNTDKAKLYVSVIKKYGYYMLKCECGNIVHDGDNFCKNCGKKLPHFKKDEDFRVLIPDELLEY